MTSIESWFLNRLLKREVTQGYRHQNNIRNLYRLIYGAAKEEFCEDNNPTLEDFLTEQYEEALKEIRRQQCPVKFVCKRGLW